MFLNKSTCAVLYLIDVINMLALIYDAFIFRIFNLFQENCRSKILQFALTGFRYIITLISCHFVVGITSFSMNLTVSILKVYQHLLEASVKRPIPWVNIYRIRFIQHNTLPCWTPIVHVKFLKQKYANCFLFSR